jgi:hypothetical protein
MSSSSPSSITNRLRKFSMNQPAVPWCRSSSRAAENSVSHLEASRCWRCGKAWGCRLHSNSRTRFVGGKPWFLLPLSRFLRGGDQRDNIRFHIQVAANVGNEHGVGDLWQCSSLLHHIFRTRRGKNPLFARDDHRWGTEPRGRPADEFDHRRFEHTIKLTTDFPERAKPQPQIWDRIERDRHIKETAEA